MRSTFLAAAVIALLTTNVFAAPPADPGPNPDMWGYPAGYQYGKDGDATNPNGNDGYPGNHPNNPNKPHGGPGGKGFGTGNGGDGGNGAVDPNTGEVGSGGRGGDSGTSGGCGGKGGNGANAPAGSTKTGGNGGDGGYGVQKGGNGGDGGSGQNGGHAGNGGDGDQGGNGGKGGTACPPFPTRGIGGTGGNGGNSTGAGKKGGNSGDSGDHKGANSYPGISGRPGDGPGGLGEDGKRGSEILETFNGPRVRPTQDYFDTCIAALGLTDTNDRYAYAAAPEPFAPYDPDAIEWLLDAKAGGPSVPGSDDVEGVLHPDAVSAERVRFIIEFTITGPDPVVAINMGTTTTGSLELVDPQAGLYRATFTAFRQNGDYFGSGEDRFTYQAINVMVSRFDVLDIGPVSDINLDGATSTDDAITAASNAGIASGATPEDGDTDGDTDGDADVDAADVQTIINALP